jgi:hypothetical protein
MLKPNAALYSDLKKSLLCWITLPPFTLQIINLNPIWWIRDGGRIYKFGVNLVINIKQ